MDLGNIFCGVDGWCVFALVIDCCTREVLGHALRREVVRAGEQGGGRAVFVSADELLVKDAGVVVAADVDAARSMAAKMSRLGSWPRP